jgi:hypothetical protein
MQRMSDFVLIHQLKTKRSFTERRKMFPEIKLRNSEGIKSE